MKRLRKAKGNVVKGAPSGLMISLMVHTAAFMLAGMLVVFNVVQKEEKKFVPPKPVDRPKMKLKKPKVKVKKSAKPKSTTRIVTKVKRASMPDIQLPEMSGLGDGLAGGMVGGFEIIPDLGEINVLGSDQSIGCDLEGTFYDLNRRRNGSTMGMETDVFSSEIVKFCKSGWRSSSLAQYYKSPKKLYATTIAVPPMESAMAPSAFDEPDSQGRTWVVHYKGKLVNRDGISFRFVGNSDDIMAIRVDGEVVLDASRVESQIDLKWQPDSADDRKWYMAHDYSAVSHLIELEPGVPKDLEIIIGEKPGGVFNAMLCVMEEGVDYPLNRFSAPILPLFKTAEIPRRLQDLIYRGSPEEEVDVVNGPIFNDYSTSSSSSPEPAVEITTDEVVDTVDPEKSKDDGMRLWTSVTGKTIEGRYVTTMGKDIVIKTQSGKQKKIAKTLISDADLNYISLSNPPNMKLDVGKKIRQKRLKWDIDGEIGMNEYTFTVKAESSLSSYNHSLKLDYWIIGSEIGASKYMLLDKGSDSFIPSEQKSGEYKFSGRTVTLYDWVLSHIYLQRRGERYEGFLITVTDERGVIIANRSTPTWLFKNLDQLKQLELGSFLDNKCVRVWPTPLKSPR